MKNIGLVKMFCAIAAGLAVQASHFKARLVNASTNKSEEREHIKRSKPYWGTGSKYDPHYGAQASARNLRHIQAGTHGTHNTMASLIQRGLAPWATA